ncbi:MAG: hypothetical protein DMF78_01640 [Acidobacteria bacterium]|nr:MAG: hypothetical protein DMF78_01640 [Acidobacteriota bacterium]
MSEEKKPFTVSDRRHFTSEGEVRKPEADEPAAARGPAPAARDASPGAEAAPAANAPPAPSSPVADVSPPADARPGASASRPPEAGDEHGPHLPSDFLGLLISLGAQASMLLMGGPEGEPPDLESAKALIDLLSSLKEKTEGRRTPQEDQLLEGLLYELRMAYVQATKVGPR